MKILAIDPGTTESAYVIMDSETYKPLDFGKCDNDTLMEIIIDTVIQKEDMHVVIEMVASYGMAVGQTVFETVFWIGRFYEIANTYQKTSRIYRKDVKMNLCGQTRAKDGNIIQALADRFAYNVRNKGKGIKSAQGFFYGFRDDIWQAFAVGVTYLDQC